MIHPKDKTPQTLPKLHLAIVDFDSPIYRCSAVHEDDVELGLEQAKLTLMEFVQTNIVNMCGCAEYCFIVTGPENFRRDLAITKPYKGQRANEKPIHYALLLEWAIEHYNCVISEGMEADDYAVNLHQKYQGSSVLVGMDKDNLQSAGWHHNYVKKESRFITPLEAQWSLAYQLIIGDAGDNIPGLPRVGDKGAHKLFDANPELPPMQVAYNVYKEKDMLGEFYEEQYRLLYMLRDTVVDFESSFIQIAVVLEVEPLEAEEDDGLPKAQVNL